MRFHNNKMQEYKIKFEQKFSRVKNLNLVQKKEKRKIFKTYLLVLREKKTKFLKIHKKTTNFRNLKILSK
jgi:hypothetical protein